MLAKLRQFITPLMGGGERRKIKGGGCKLVVTDLTLATMMSKVSHSPPSLNLFSLSSICGGGEIL